MEIYRDQKIELDRKGEECITALLELTKMTGKGDKMETLQDDDEERFKYLFGCYPEVFGGAKRDYEFTFTEEMDFLLKEFGFCPACIGSGVAWTECCYGTRGCECQGGSVSYPCRNCNNTGRIDQSFEPNANRNYILSLAQSNNGYLFKKEF